MGLLVAALNATIQNKLEPLNSEIDRNEIDDIITDVGVAK